MRSFACVLLCSLACAEPRPQPPQALAAAPQAASTAAAPKPPPALPPAPPLPPTPAFLGEVVQPSENPTTPEKAALGHMLFFDARLSRDGSKSCAACHLPDKAWIVPEALSAKVGGAMNVRNAPTMLNLGYHTSFYWDGRMPTLEKVSNAAWKGQLGADPAVVATRLGENAVYRALFQRTFGAGPSAENIPMALAAFLRALKSGDSPWDRYEQGEANAVSPEAVKGFEVFRKAECALCHTPPLYTDLDFHNVGVGWDKTPRDKGRMDATGDPADEGKFKTPSLRDVALTAPYFHDGSAATLDEAIDFMLAGGKPNPNLDPKLKARQLSPEERKALKAFLESLTGKHTYTSAPVLPE